jgi:hypothetical protein
MYTHHQDKYDKIDAGLMYVYDTLLLLIYRLPLLYVVLDIDLQLLAKMDEAF